MAQKGIAMTSAIEMDDSMNHPTEAAAVTGDSNHPKENRNQADTAADTPPPAAQVVEGQRENLIYTEELGFLPMRKDPRYTFYRHPKHENSTLPMKMYSMSSKKQSYSNIWNFYKFPDPTSL